MVEGPGPNQASAADPTVALGAVLAQTVAHFFPKWNRWVGALRDPRDPLRIIYPARFLVWTGLLLFLCKLGARRQLLFTAHAPTFLTNLNVLAETRLEQVEHPDTLAYLLGRLALTELPRLLTALVRRLLRMKVLDRFRLDGHVLVAVDGTGWVATKTRHCDHCLTKTHDGKVLYYYHHAVEAKLVTALGFTCSLATEFLENVDPNASKQDCEQKAFHRLAATVKRAFPQLRICLLLDSLFACEPVVRCCHALGWRYVITFKAGSMPERWDEFQRLKCLTPAYRRTLTRSEGTTQAFAWVHGLPVGEEVANVLECIETAPDGTVTTFVWLTNWPLDATTAPRVANDGGRQRWKIENQGFNDQKCGGYALEHLYSEDWHTAKNFYVLLQIAHLLAQLVEYGNLLRRALQGTIREMVGGVRSLARYLRESLRTTPIPPEAVCSQAAASIQIRLDSS